MFSNTRFEQHWQDFIEWCSSVFWTEDTLYQAVMVLFSYVLGSLFASILRINFRNRIKTDNLPAGIRNILGNMGRLVTPAITLVLLFFATLIASSDLVELDTGIARGVMKLLVAWIVIRALVQFIQNQFIRNFLAISVWSVAALSIFGVLDETMTALDAVGFNIGNFRLSALAVVKSVFSLVVLLYMALFASSFAEQKVLQAKGLKRSSQVLIAKSIRIALIVFALLIGVTSAGIDLSIFAVFSGAVGLGIGFGLQKVISNLFSGMLLLMDKSIVPGDVIEMDDGSGAFGWVNYMGARYTEVITRDNKSFLIPNEDFITRRVINWSHGNTLIRTEVKFGVDYSHDPHEVIKLAMTAVDKPERACKEPAPVCHLVEFGDNSLNFVLRFWIKDAEKGMTNVRGQVMLELWSIFKENNIKIPYPHREVYIHEKKAS